MSNTKYKEICEAWITCYSWTLDDAIFIIAKMLPAPYFTSLKTEQKEQIEIFKTLARNSLGGALDIQDSIPGDKPDCIRVNPLQFIEWIESLGFPIPHVLNQARQDQIMKDGQPSRKAPPSTTHNHRCRGIAEYLWSLEPTLTKKDMAQKSELLQFGCENGTYASSTIEGWIKDLNPNRSQGRRKTQ